MVEVIDSFGHKDSKLTINHEAIFDVSEGAVFINIDNKKKLKKFVYKPSLIQILFYD